MHTAEFQYIQSSQNSQIFLAHYLPSEQRTASKDNKAVIFVPPFAEEMNRSKRMYVLCARLLADSGIHAICFDYSGTGDSSGEWGEFSYSDWVGDLNDVYQYYSKAGKSISFVALRFGALVLTDAIADYDLNAARCVFWDPIENGEMLTRQLIRMKIAAAMADTSKKLTTQEIKDSIKNNGHLESGGYHISESLLDSINSKKITNSMASLLARTHIDWMTLGRYKDAENKWLANSFTASELDVSDLQDKLTMHPVNDVKFWMQQEVTISPALLRATREMFIRGE